MTIYINKEVNLDKIKSLGTREFKNGLSLIDYPGYEKWTNKQWAWEFLRRKKNFQFFCKRYKKKNKETKKILYPNLESAFRDLFGLEKHLCYDEAFDCEKLKFVTEHIVVYSSPGNQEATPSKKISLELMPGDMYLKFNLAISAQSNKNINQLLKSAKNILEIESKKFALNNDIIKQNTRNKINYIDLVRLIDLTSANELLKKVDRLSHSEICTVIFPIQSGIYPDGNLKSNTELQRFFQKKIALAKAYMKKDRYLDLAATKDLKSR